MSLTPSLRAELSWPYCQQQKLSKCPTETTPVMMCRITAMWQVRAAWDPMYRTLGFSRISVPHHQVCSYITHISDFFPKNWFHCVTLLACTSIRDLQTKYDKVFDPTGIPLLWFLESILNVG